MLTHIHGSMHMSDPPDPTPAIRAVLLTGFFSGNAVGLVYMAVRGVLLEAIQLNPLAVFGGFLFVGLLGLMVGAFSGLSLKLLLDKVSGDTAPWWMPAFVAGCFSALVGFYVTHGMTSFFWG
jgi:hypothetical protein